VVEQEDTHAALVLPYLGPVVGRHVSSNLTLGTKDEEITLKWLEWQTRWIQNPLSFGT
jgi:hypothetical protein